MKTQLLFLAAIAIGIGAFALFAKRVSAVDQHSQALELKIVELQRSLEEARQPAPDTKASDSAAQAQKLELMRLRNEVTQLRASSQELAAARAENTRLRSEIEGLRSGSNSSEDDGKTGSIPREHWTFRGFSTPEASVLTGLWAMRDGQVETFRNSMSPEERERFEKMMQGKTDAEIAARFQKEFGKVTGVRLLGQNEAGPDEVILNVYLEGVDGTKRFRLNKVGQEWKHGGPVNQNMNLTPQNAQPAVMEAYRRNPELMKRYFPHLFQEGQNPPVPNPPPGQ